MTELRVAHVVRHYGGVTEPFIADRVVHDLDGAELWSERVDQPPRGRTVHLVRLGPLAPGTLGDRAFHRFPAVGPPLAGAYARLENARRPDVIHAHYLTTGWLVGSRTRAPLVVSAYGFDATALPRRIGWRRAFKALARRASTIVAEGPHMRQTLLRLGFGAGQVTVVPISAGFERIAFTGRPVNDGPLRIVSCGRLVDKKGHDLAIRAFAAARLPTGSSLEIIGAGPRRHALGELIAELGLGASVRLLGGLSRDAWLARLGRSDLLLVASREAANGDAEGGAPTTILDAQAAGVTVVGSTHADIPFLIADGVTGYLGPEGDAAGLARSLSRAVDDRMRWPAVRGAARRQVDQRHSTPSAVAALQRIHHEAARR